MNEEVMMLKQEAEHYKFLYQTGQITREEAKEHITPYLDCVNNKAKELAKKYNMKKYKKVSFISFVR